MWLNVSSIFIATDRLQCMKKQGFCLLGLFCAWQASATDLRVAIWESAAPYNVKTEGGWKGPCVDVYRAIEAIDPQLHFVLDDDPMPIRRIEYELSAGRRDIICGARKNASREAAGMQFLKQGLHTTGYRLAVRAGDVVVVNNWDDVKKLGKAGKVLIMQGHAEIERLQQLGVILDSGTPTAEQNLIKLEAGRGRFFYHRDSFFKSGAYSPKNHPNIRLLPVILDPSPAYIAGGKMVPKEVMAQIDNAFSKLVRNGELNRIIKANALD